MGKAKWLPKMNKAILILRLEASPSRLISG